MLREFHLSDRELLMASDGELSAREAKRVESHLAACWECRTRKQELEGAIGEFIRFQRSSSGNPIPPPDGPRALLKAQLERLAETERVSRPRWLRTFSWRQNWPALTAAMLLAGIIAIAIPRTPRGSFSATTMTVPNPSFTPGATVLVSRREVCQAPLVNDKPVPRSLERIVFAEYGIGTPEAGAYEVDYLITPALGGADDVHNLWPQPSRGTIWNAQAKDALEGHLRALVCGGELDLATAQREIAGNWIEAYKKYFRTDRPLTALQ